MWSFSFIFGHQLKLGGGDDDDGDNSGIILRMLSNCTVVQGRMLK
jgi:hypothetical protein